MGRKTSVFAPYFFACFTDDIGFWTDENSINSEDWQMKKAPVLFFIYARFYKQKQKN